MKFKTANLNVRMTPELLDSFRKLVAEHKQAAPPEVIRDWITKYVDSGGRDDHFDYVFMYQQISDLTKENLMLKKVLRGDFEKEEQRDLEWYNKIMNKDQHV